MANKDLFHLVLICCRYKVDENGDVILHSSYSPTNSVGTKVLNGLDIVGAVGGVASGGVGIATTVLSSTTLTVASPILAVSLPVAGVAALATGAVVGAYSIVRSSMMIHDRVQREEVSTC